jgi:hypothetical protein
LSIFDSICKLVLMLPMFKPELKCGARDSRLCSNLIAPRHV